MKVDLTDIKAFGKQGSRKKSSRGPRHIHRS